MINIKFNPSEYELSISGHANQSKKGKDIVCAAVSILYFTLVESLNNFDEKAYEGKIEYSFSDGNGAVKVKPKKEYEQTITLVYYTVLNGLSLLAEEYPQFIKTNF